MSTSQVTWQTLVCLVISFMQCVCEYYDKSLHENIPHWQTICLKKVKYLRARDIIQLRTTGNWDTDALPLQLWALCVMVQSGIMTNQGVFRTDVALKEVPIDEKDFFMKAVNKCLYQKRHEPHEKAWHYLKCVNKANPRDFRILPKTCKNVGPSRFKIKCQEEQT